MSHDFQTTHVFKSIEPDKRLVTGWAAVSTGPDGQPVIDHDGDFIPVHELEKAAQAAFLDGGAGKGGDMHERTGVADLVESIVVTDQKREKLGFGAGQQGWIVTLKIKDDDLWDDIKSGRKTELSLRGRGKRVPMSEAA